MKTQLHTLIAIAFITAVSFTLPTLADDCDAILWDGIYDEYEYSSEQEFQSDLKRSLSLSEEEKRKMSSASETGFNLGLKKVLSLGFDNELEKEYLEELSRFIKLDEQLAWKSYAYQQIKRRVANEKIVDAWLECKIRTGRGIRSSTNGNIHSENGKFILTIDNMPRRKSDSDLRITDLQVVGATPSGQGSLKGGAKLNRYSGLSEVFTRDGRSSVSITVTFDAAKSVTTSLAEIEKKHVLKWHKKDPTEILYSKTFHHNTGKGRKRTIKSGIYRIDKENVRIYRVDFRHEGSAKLWNYHTTNGHGSEYKGDTSIIEDGRAFIWRRIWEGGNVDEYYTAYYEVWR